MRQTKGNVVSQDNKFMITRRISVQRDNKKNVLLTVAMLTTMGNIGNIGNTRATRGNIIIIIASWRKHPGGQKKQKQQ